jgi:hypothetical protein
MTNLTVRLRTSVGERPHSALCGKMIAELPIPA